MYDTPGIVQSQSPPWPLALQTSISVVADATDLLFKDMMWLPFHNGTSSNRHFGALALSGIGRSASKSDPGSLGSGGGSDGDSGGSFRGRMVHKMVLKWCPRLPARC